MQRCFDLALNGIKTTLANPMVGAVLVHQGLVIGEGYHKSYGGPHAEVEAINSVSQENRIHIPESTLYVSLEPCCIANKTPACTSLIIKEKIKEVYISVLDPNPKVNGKGMKLLQENGVNVYAGILLQQGKILIRKFEANLKSRPYKVIKFAQSLDRYISKKDEQTSISSQETNVLVHQWRSKFDGILVGTQTALIDNPKLNVRHVAGPSPTRIVIDKDLVIPRTHHLWSDDLPTIFISSKNDETTKNKTVIQLNFEEDIWIQLDPILIELGIFSIMIEGGAHTIKQLIKSHTWDEARIITSRILIRDGVKAPLVTGQKIRSKKIGTDEIDIVFNNMNVNIR